MLNSRKPSYNELLKFLIPAVLLIFLAFYAAYQFVSPAPSRNITISAGPADGSYYEFANKYSDALKNEDIELKVLKSTGSRENIQRLLNEEVDIAFVQGGTEFKDEPLYSLGSLYYEPLLIFYKRGLAVRYLSDLKSLKISIGEEGSGTRILAQQLLQINHVNANNTKFLSLTNQEAVSQLMQGDIDVAFFVTAINSSTIKPLFSVPDIKLFDIQRAAAYTRVFPALSAIILHQGILSFNENIPEESVTLLASTANLVVDEDFNKPLSILLLQAMQENHGETAFFSVPQFFPNPELSAFPVTDVAQRFYKNGPPFLMKYLPFWAATFVDRMIVMILPLFVIILPLIKILPPLYRWRIRSKIYCWYRELQKVDDYVIGRQLSEAEFKQVNDKLDEICIQTRKVDTPLSYADELYNLQVHIDLIRNMTRANRADKQTNNTD